MGPELFHQSGTAVGYGSRIVADFPCVIDAAAIIAFFDQQRLALRPSGIDGCRKPGGASADNNDIVHLVHVYHSFACVYSYRYSMTSFCLSLR